MIRPAFASLLILGLIALAALTAPGCDDNPVSSYEPIVSNEADNFHLVVKDADGVDTTVYYFWSMSGTTANVDQTSDIKGGSVSIIVDDNDRVVVYSTDLSGTGSFTTLTGTSGTWRIRVTLKDFSGLFDFRLQRK